MIFNNTFFFVPPFLDKIPKKKFGLNKRFEAGSESATIPKITNDGFSKLVYVEQLLLVTVAYFLALSAPEMLRPGKRLVK